MNSKQTGLFLKERRIEKGFTIQEMSKRLNIPQEEIQEWEKGITYPNSKEIPFLADMLGVSIENIYYGEKEIGKMKKGTADFLVMASSIAILAGILSYFLLKDIDQEVSIMSMITFISIGVLTLLYVGLKTE